MTKPMMDLRAPMEKGGDVDLLRQLIGFAAERLVELEVGAKTARPIASYTVSWDIIHSRAR